MVYGCHTINQWSGRSEEWPFSSLLWGLDGLIVEAKKGKKGRLTQKSFQIIIMMVSRGAELEVNGTMVDNCSLSDVILALDKH